MTTETYTILNEKREDVEKKLRRVVKKAQKYGIPFSASFGEPYAYEVKRDGCTELYEVVDLTIESDIIRNGKYSIIARIEHAEQGNIVNVFAGEMKAEWAKIPAHCDHCNSNHNQKITVIVSDGETEKQVGRTCLKEYCGIDPQMIGLFNQFAEDIEEYTPELFDERIPVVYDAVETIALAIETVREQGYRKSDERGSNKVVLADKLGEKRHPSEDAMMEAEKMADAILAMSVEEAVDANLNNVRTRIAGFYCKASDLGYFAYAPVAYEKYVERTAKRNAWKQADDILRECSKHIGTVGDKITVNTVEAKLLTSFDTYYGTTFLYRFIDADNNVYVWFSSKCVDCDNTTKITGTVKDHSERNGIKQTVLTRVKILEKSVKEIEKTA